MLVFGEMGSMISDFSTLDEMWIITSIHKKQKVLLSGSGLKNIPMDKTAQTKDLEKFIEKFEPSKFKMLQRGIEIRGMKDLNRSIAFAKELIDQLKLKLNVSHSAEMAMYGSFEVVYQ